MDGSRRDVVWQAQFALGASACCSRLTGAKRRRGGGRRQRRRT